LGFNEKAVPHRTERLLLHFQRTAATEAGSKLHKRRPLRELFLSLSFISNGLGTPIKTVRNCQELSGIFATQPVSRPVVVRRNPRKALESACKDLGVPHYSSRALRRCFIIHCLETGVDPRVVAEWQAQADTTSTFGFTGNMFPKTTL